MTILTTSLAEELRAILSSLVGGVKYGVKIRLPHALIMTFLFRRDLSTRHKVRIIVKLVGEHAMNLASFATLYKSIILVLKLASRKLRDAPKLEQASAWRSIGRWILDALVDGPMSIDSQYKLPSNSVFDSFQLSSTTAAPAGHPEYTYHSFLAGAIGGYFVWGRHSAVNQQIVLYLASRVLVGLWQRATSQRRSVTGSDITMTAKNAMINQQTDLGGSHSSSSGYPIAAALIWGIVMALWESSPEVLQSSLKKSMDEIYRHDLFQKDKIAITRRV